MIVLDTFNSMAERITLQRRVRRLSSRGGSIRASWRIVGKRSSMSQSKVGQFRFDLQNLLGTKVCSSAQTKRSIIVVTKFDHGVYWLLQLHAIFYSVAPTTIKASQTCHTHFTWSKLSKQVAITCTSAFLIITHHTYHPSCVWHSKMI